MGSTDRLAIVDSHGTSSLVNVERSEFAHSMGERVQKSGHRREVSEHTCQCAHGQADFELLMMQRRTSVEQVRDTQELEILVIINITY